MHVRYLVKMLQLTITTVISLLIVMPAAEGQSSGPGQVSPTVCVVPPYAVPLEEVVATPESESILLAEWSCYLSCLRNSSERIRNFPAPGGTYGVCVTVCNEALYLQK